MEKNLILLQVNALGAVLGYPFHIYADGTCGKKMVSETGKANSVIVVKKPFAVNDLQSDYLTGSVGASDEILAHLAEVAEKNGYPLYVYADGTCGKEPKSPTNNEPFVLRMKGKVEAKKVVLAPDFWEKSANVSEDDVVADVDLDTLSEEDKQETLKELVTEHVSVCAKHCTDKVIAEIVACCGMPTELLKGLLEEERFELIEKLQITYELNLVSGSRHELPNVRYLLENGYAKLLKNTIDKRGFSDSEFAALLKSGDDEMFEYYIMRHSLSGAWASVLIGCGTSRMIKKYQETDEFSNSLKYRAQKAIRVKRRQEWFARVKKASTWYAKVACFWVFFFVGIASILGNTGLAIKEILSE